MKRETYERHLAALEAQNRRLLMLVRLSSIAVGLMATLVLVGWKSSQVGAVIQAQRFEVLSPEGKVVGQFGHITSGGSKLTARNSAGTVVFEAGEALNHDGNFASFDADGVKRFFVAPAEGSPENYLMSLTPNLNRTPSAPKAIQIGHFSREVAGIRLYGSSAASPVVHQYVRSDDTSEIGVLAPWSGGVTLRSQKGHGELHFVNVEKEGTTTTLVSSLYLNTPAGYVSETGAERGVPMYWPKTPPENLATYLGLLRK